MGKNTFQALPTFRGIVSSPQVLSIHHSLWPFSEIQ